MNLRQLLACVPDAKPTGDDAVEITSLCYDSRQVTPGALFFALRGVKSDGTEFVASAVKGGAVAIIADRPCAVAGVTCVEVPDARRAMSLMAAVFYGTPTGDIPLVGITGTNGKTTTTYLVEGIMERAGVPAAVLGTISYRFGDTSIPAPNTTPESVDLQRILRELVDQGAKGAVMEVSSHSLEQRRADGCIFDVAIFTNLTRDHLDYHVDMESYYQSKLRLFTDLLTPNVHKPLRRAVVNLDDPYGARIAAESAAPVLTYAVDGPADLSVAEVNFSVHGIRCRLNSPVGEININSDLLGRFNLYNIMGAVGAGLALGVPREAIEAGIEGHKKVPGRLERVPNEQGIIVLVDYAHTGDALENVLSTIAELKTDRIITLFGCGGDRDKGKRPVMGEIAARYSDLAIVTSDNPRTEDPEAILADVRAGIPAGLKEYSLEELEGGVREKGFATIESRRTAVRAAILAARPGDIVLLAGKGHEDYQIVGTEKFHFDDREEAAAALKLRA
ncbi:UDP-N-acetylmuramoyl-L-alanyl-D-glutamate--2,6-diaminopimelate ligase [Geomonas subterranea]|uniref:UDP-N-acetylmuramoyl-L-alanyl-D-glutamate--2,6-diaminopimelate ligase n=1 Tax=Geomonas subterranea TaxID=2847989 RepID=A0ABX8LIY3_9BACT|nr:MULTISPECIES: UDP-N-acetylmuramoyl-L-alanyl-D-glutamate--2,6-diaminopimelate ligase [Geomonas]QXE89520.1 UDP-N-acetylmuramoyl-L-alanyl-D-glutamate--2,6-diaminopimelate ligase [Geomonas subterranea]QXM08365.1 UDP-N-acetylmuramoyl-L-alanyl-D-glutamate--2,6-diaminopimelate ligase [Geomonas subterranea]